jgi:hypothetical protein
LNPTKESGGEQLVRVGEKRGDQSLSHESGQASQAAASDQDSKKQRRELYTVEERMRRLMEALEGQKRQKRQGGFVELTAYETVGAADIDGEMARNPGRFEEKNGKKENCDV